MSCFCGNTVCKDYRSDTVCYGKDRQNAHTCTYTHTLTLTLARALVERRFVSGVNVHVDNVFLSDNAKCIH